MLPSIVFIKIRVAQMSLILVDLKLEISFKHLHRWKQDFKRCSNYSSVHLISFLWAVLLTRHFTTYVLKMLHIPIVV